ncbi:immunoglobulin lambda-1 light chain-like [Amblyraja radiata]|uniref:immunoglobulin lambda-1 light chain-like n=1 Tax=Amblyraja radiata TaxID=386614 RepID=UPI001403F00D|nr:immunoglobulin lambda-1 light chain-like [Amblyraja radiata]
MTYCIRLLCALALCATYLRADVTVSQPLSMSITPGQNLELTCTMSGATLGNDNVYWYQQIPGRTPRLLVYYWSSKSTPGRGPGVSERFSGSVSGNTGTFTISSVQSDDAADYYCAMWKNILIFAKGTRVAVGNPQPPAASVLPPSADEMRVKGTATLVCLVSGFNPGAVEIQWTVDGSARNDGIETSRIQQEKDNTFSASSYLTLPATVWNSHELYSCVVKHETQATPLRVDIAKSSCM